MARIRKVSDIVEFQISSEGRRHADLDGSGADIVDPNRLEYFDSDIRAIKAVIASANDKIHLIGESMKTFNQGLTELNKSFFVTKDTASRTRDAIGVGNSRLLNASETTNMLHSENTGSLYEAQMKVKGARAKELLKSRVSEIGGSVSFFHDKATVSFPVMDSQYQQYANEHANYVKGVSNPLARLQPEARIFRELFGDVSSANTKETAYARREEKRKEKEREQEQETKRKEAIEEYNRKRLDPETYAGEKLRERLGGDKVLNKFSPEQIQKMIIANDKQEEKRKEKEREAKKKEAEEEKHKRERADNIKSISSKVFGVIAIGTALVSLTRRILNVLGTFGRERREAGLEARALGLSASDIIEAKYAEQGRGLKEGTITGALTALQQKFGDPRNLDEGALRELAPYLPQTIAPLVRSGMYGGSNSQELLAMILDGAVERIGKGLNWSGEQVGEREARRNIISSLERVSPDLAKIANNMYDTNRFGIYAGGASTYAQWKNVGFGSQNPLSLAQLENNTQMYDMVTGRFSSGWDNFKTQVISLLSGILSTVEQSGIGLSDEEKLAKKYKDYQSAVAKESELSSTYSAQKKLFEQQLKSRGVDFDSGTYGKGMTLDKFLTASDSQFEKVLMSDASIGTAMQDRELLQQYIALRVLAKSKGELSTQINKFKSGNIKGFSFDRLKFTPETIGLISGDVTGRMSKSYLGSNYVDIMSSLFGAPTESNMNISDVEAYAYEMAQEQGLDLNFGTMSRTASLDALHREYAIGRKNDNLAWREQVLNVYSKIYRSLGIKKSMSSLKNMSENDIYTELQGYMNRGELTNETVNYFITKSGSGLASSMTQYLSNQAKKLPQGFLDMAEKGLAERRTQEAQQKYALFNAIFGDSVVSNIMQRKNVTGGTVTAQDEYTLAVTLNVNENGKVQSQTFRIKNNSSGIKQGASASFDIGKAYEQKNSY